MSFSPKPLCLRSWKLEVLALIIVVSGVAVRPDTLHAQDGQASGWLIEGEIGSYFDYYDAFGDTSQSSYSALGPYGYTDFLINGENNFSRFNRLRFSGSGVYNRSVYRNARHTNLILEKANLGWTNGEAPVPFKLDIGDFFGNLSLRTMQRGLKGVQIELQPRSDDPNHNTSLMLFTGQSHPTYRDFNFGEELFSGVSYLAARRDGDVSLNLAHSFRKANSTAGLPVMNQLVSSLAFERRWRSGANDLKLESELSYLYGDSGTSASDFRSGNSGFGVYTKLSGRNRRLPLTWNIVYERYDRNFAPRGGAVTANNEKLQFDATYRLKNGQRLKSRLQKYTTALQSNDPTNSYTYGLDIVGPFAFLGNGTSGSIKALVKDTATHSGSSHTVTYSGTGNFTKPIGRGVNLLWGLSHTRVDDLVSNQDSDTSTANVALDFSGLKKSLQYHIAPKVSFNRTAGNSGEVWQYGGGIAFGFKQGNHALSADYALLFNDNHNGSSADTLTHNAGLRYSYATASNTFGLEGKYTSRDATTQTQSYNVRAYFRHRFSNTPAQQPELQGYQFASSDSPEDVRLAALAPGMSLQGAIQTLRDGAIEGGSQRGPTIVYEVLWLDGIDARQRLFLTSENGRIVKSGLIISFPEPGDAQASQRLYREVLDAMARRYGNPSIQDEGQFDADFPQTVLRDELIRNAEWRLPEGTIRLGIPNRLDRQVQMEIHFSRGFASPNQTRWGQEGVR